jgi:hypothetical protein
MQQSCDIPCNPDDMNTSEVQSCPQQLETASNRFFKLLQLYIVSSATTFSIFCVLRPSLSDIYNDIDLHLNEVAQPQTLLVTGSPTPNVSAAGHLLH